MCFLVSASLLQCVVGGCNASFASQGGLARHVPSHFSQQNSSRMSGQAKLKEDSPSKAGLNKRKKLRNKRRCSLRTYLTGARTDLIPKCFSLCFSLLSVLKRITTWAHFWGRAVLVLLLNSHMSLLEKWELDHTHKHQHKQELLPARQTHFPHGKVLHFSRKCFM